MKKITVFAFLLLFIPAISGALPSQKAYSQFSVLPFKQKANGDYLSIRPSFIENKGQQDKDILYYVNTSTYQIGFGVNAIYLNIPQNTTTNCITKKNSIKGHCVVISFHDANVCTPKGQDPHLQKSNFFQGNDCSQWHKGVSHYSSIVYENVYNHIDFVFCINENRLFWQYNVKPGARMQDIDFRVQGG